MSGHIASSQNLNWNTPHWVREGLLHVFSGPATLDPCSNSTSVMETLVKYLLPENDGLVDPWDLDGPGTTVYVNPPFGRCYITPDRRALSQKEHELLTDEDKKKCTSTSLADWVRRASAEWTNNQVQTVMLLPASVDTQAYQRHIFLNASSICFVRGRIRFLQPDGTPSGPSPMACALVGWLTPETSHRFLEAFSSKGACVPLR